MKLVLLAAALLATAAWSHPSESGGPRIAWKKPAEPTLSWRGIPKLDGGADAAGGALYPAPSLLGFLASIVAHAAVSSAAQSAEQAKAQKEADTVLAPYATAISGLSAEALWRSALASTLAPPGASLTESPAEGWRAEATPRFSLAPDAGTLVLDLGARVQAPAGAPMELVVRVVSSPPEVVDPKAHWAADDAKALRETAVALLAHALSLVTQEALARQAAAAPAAETPFRTHRYRLGPLTRAERSQLLDSRCGRLVLRTLRGGLLSVPALSEARGTVDAAASAPAHTAGAPPAAEAQGCQSAPGL